METKLKFNSTDTFEDLFNKSLFDENILKKRIEVDFSDALESVDIPDIYFNNYLESRKSPMTKYFKSQYKRMLNSENYNLLEDYEIKPVKGNSNYKKISKIVKKTSGNHYDYSELFFRLKNINRKTNFYNPGLQFYYILQDDKYKIIFIDLYHMVIPAHNRDYPGAPKNPMENYDRHKNGSYNLSNFKE